MDITIATRGVAYVALTGVLLAAAITLNDRPHPATPAWNTELSPSALDAELARCKAIGTEAANDVVCKAVWDANRKRFFESGKPYQDRATGAVPGTSDLNEPVTPSRRELARSAAQVPPAQDSDVPRLGAEAARQPQ
jgi:conjugative transfer region protein TrbK